MTSEEELKELTKPVPASDPEGHWIPHSASGPPSTTQSEHRNDGIDEDGRFKKPRASLLYQRAIDEMLQGMEYGARKHGDHSYKETPDPITHFDSVSRHIAAWARGESIDSESGIEHLALAMCRLMMLMYHDEEKPGWRK